jgi:pimeloyl-ACP methyl ester carboxylesterase
MRGLVFSRYGYGRSTPRPATEKWPVDFMHVQAHEVLPALFARLGIEDPPWLFGHSDGGSIALLYAAAFPARVAGLVAVPTRSSRTQRASNEQRACVRDRLRQEAARHHDDPDRFPG